MPWLNLLLITTSHDCHMIDLQVDTTWAAGDYEGARSHSRSALNWNIASISMGIILGVVGGIIGGMAYATQPTYDY